MDWKNRIVGQASVDPKTLRSHPANARRHPSRQRRALSTAIDEIGLIQDVIVNQRTGYIIDGHLRVDLAIAEQQPKIPVKYVDLEKHEEALVLATFDPIASLAFLDVEEMAELRDSVAPNLGKPLADLIGDLAPAPAPAKPDREKPADPDDDDEPDDDDGHPNDGPAGDDNTELGFTLLLPSRAIPMSAAEFRDLTNAFFAYLETNGMAFGFVRWLCQ